MTIKKQGGIFGRNPTFNDVEVDGTLTVGGNAVPDASTLLVDGDIGSTVQAYDADTAKYDDATAAFTGNLSVDSTTLYVDATDDRVGIGTSSPATYGDANTKFAVVSDTSGTADVNLRWGTNAVKGILYCNDLSGAGIGIGSTTSANLGFLTNGQQRMTIDTSGNITVSAGNLVIGTSGNGIDFSATAGTGTSELFDDYEEGSYTLTFYDAASGGNASSTTATAYYTKVGRTVTISCAFVANISTAGMTGGNVLYVSLPFAPDGTIGSSVGNSVFQSMTYPASGTATYLSIGTGARANFISQASAGTTTNITVGDVTSGTTDLVRLSATYIAA